MGSIEEVLPPEVLTRILRSLSDRRRDIAACRRVCWGFHACCSEFLVTRVTFAKRFDTIQRLWEVLEHPYYRRHVTELVYDASLYQESIVTDFEHYEDACDRHCMRTFCGDEGIEEMQRYAQFYHRVCRARPWCGPIDASKKWHEKGMHKGFHDYFRRWLIQTQMVEDGLDGDIVTKALARLPKLRRIVFTDFRELAREEEEYTAACKRKFGNTLEPLGLRFTDDTFREFMLLLYMVAESPQADIKSLSIGGHPYESFVHCWTTTNSVMGDMHRPFDRPAMPYHPDHHSGDIESTEQVCGNLQNLRLPIAFRKDVIPDGMFDLGPGIEGTFVGQILKFSTPRLVQLSLSASDLVGLSNHGNICVYSKSRQVLEFLLFPLKFNSLQHLGLQGWPLPAGTSFQEFLSEHSSTLRELRLIGCVVSEDPEKTWSMGRGEHKSQRRRDPITFRS